MGSEDTRVGTEDEFDHAELAIEEREATGNTERRCLRCGGFYILEEYGNSYVIRCENGDFRLIARGI